MRGTRLAADASLEGEGCRGPWYHLILGGSVCSEQARVVSGEPGGQIQPPLPPHSVLPGRYVLVRRDGSAEYATPDDLLADMPLRELAPGFGRTVLRRIVREETPMWRTTRGTYVPAEDVFLVRGSRFQGQRLHGTRDLPLAFLYRRGTKAYRAPGRRSSKRIRRFTRFHPTQVVLLSRPGHGVRPTFSSPRRRGRRTWHSRYLQARFEPAGVESLSRPRRHKAIRRLIKKRSQAFLRLPSGWWIRADQVRAALPSAPPREVGVSTKWVDIDLLEQTLVAYEGEKPVYATLVSTGRDDRTPVGLFRVWAKLAKTDMQGTRRTEYDDEPELSYSMWDVPWTMYFRSGIALHGTYWHGLFGRVRSHGCVNLSPADAKWIFDWSDPPMPAGWSAILPGPGEATLLVRVRRGGATLSIIEHRIKPVPRH